VPYVVPLSHGRQLLPLSGVGYVETVLNFTRRTSRCDALSVLLHVGGSGQIGRF
jgi:hypothetical protein